MSNRLPWISRWRSGIFQAGHVLCHRPAPAILYNKFRSEASMWHDNFHDPETRYRAPESAVDAVAIDAPQTGGETATGIHGEDENALDITQRYFEDISRLRILKADEEQAYARRMRDGDEEAREVLITHNFRLVVYVTKRYLGRGLPLLDLVEEGNLGLMHALEKFDPG